MNCTVGKSPLLKFFSNSIIFGYLQNREGVWKKILKGYFNVLFCHLRLIPLCYKGRGIGLVLCFSSLKRCRAISIHVCLIWIIQIYCLCCSMVNWPYLFFFLRSSSTCVFLQNWLDLLPQFGTFLLCHYDNIYKCPFDMIQGTYHILFVNFSGIGLQRLADKVQVRVPYNFVSFSQVVTFNPSNKLFCQTC